MRPRGDGFLLAFAQVVRPCLIALRGFRRGQVEEKLNKSRPAADLGNCRRHCA
jgi:hypothetical protein